MNLDTSPASALAIRDRWHDALDKYLFFGAFVVGTVLIVLLKAKGFQQAYVTFAPVAVMLLYGAYVWRSPTHRLREDRAGDALYYLGFLFTLVSLAFSLYEFTGAPSGTQQLVTNFGIALSTTICGLALRVMFHQLRRHPEDIERDVRDDLVTAARKLHGELQAAIRDFEAMRLSMTQLVTETAKGVSAEAVAAITESSKTYQENALQLATTIAELRESVNSHQKAINASARRTVTAVDRLSSRIEEMELPTDIIKGKVNALLETLGKGSEALTAQTAQQSKLLESLAGTVLAASKSVDELTERSQKVWTLATAQHQAISQGVENLSRELEAAREAVARTTSLTVDMTERERARLDALASLIDGTSVRLEALRSRLDSDTERSLSSVTQVQSSLASLAGIVVEKLR